MKDQFATPTVEIDKELYKSLKIYCIENDIRIKTVLASIVDKGLVQLMKDEGRM